MHKDWGKLDAEQYPIKNCHAMVQLKSGDFLALCDDTRHNFLLYNPEGGLKKAWMTEYPGAQGLDIFEQDGKELLIVVDLLHQLPEPLQRLRFSTHRDSQPPRLSEK